MRSLFTQNLGYKILSLVLAAGFWLVVVDEPEVTAALQAPLQFRNFPRDLELSSGTIDKVHLEVRGPSIKLTSASLGDVAVVVDLSGVRRPGERTFPITLANASLPSGLALDRAVPSLVRLRFDRRASKEVPVKVRLSAPPP